MSADNLVVALPLQKKDGQTVWRVAEVQLSSLPWDVCHLASTRIRSDSFKEFTGSDAAAQAHAYALDLESQLPICEYGAELYPANTPPLTFEQLRQKALDAGYGEDSLMSFEAA